MRYGTYMSYHTTVFGQMPTTHSATSPPPAFPDYATLSSALDRLTSDPSQHPGTFEHILATNIVANERVQAEHSLIRIAFKLNCTPTMAHGSGLEAVFRRRS
jgi:hypothetical protein